MPRVVLDSTVLVSAFLTKGGVSAALLLEARRGAFALCQSAEILEETERVLLEPGRIREHFQYSDRSVRQFVHGLRVVSQLVTRIPKIHVVSRDPNDDMVIACALKAKAGYIVSRDKDLLSLTVSPVRPLASAMGI